MPCCQCCCGGVTCTEGQQGKCCCGGPSGTCCQAGEYCCNGVCQASPCDEVDCTGSCEDGVPYIAGPEYGYTPSGLVDTSVQTITVPAQYSLPVTVCYSAGCDDGLAINGNRVSFFAQQPAPFCIESRTFEAGVWNDGGPWVCSGTFCFKEGCNPLP